MGEDLLRRLGKELAGLAVCWLVEGRGDGPGLCRVPQLGGWRPVEGTGIKGIQDDIVPVLTVETLDVLACRVVHNGRFSAVLDLAKHLTQERRFAYAGISHHLNVLRLGLQRKTDDDAFLVGRNPQPFPFRISLNCFGADITGPRSSRPYFIFLPRLKSSGTAKQRRKITTIAASASARP